MDDDRDDEKRDEIAGLTEHIASILELPESEQPDAFERLRDEHPESRAFLIRCEEAAKQLTPGVRDNDAMPERIGPYKILEVLGEGGMGTVYLAEQKEPVHRRVALKVIKLGMATKEVIARFEAERQALARMNHPCIARVLDVGTTAEGQAYFAMEHVPGIRITDYCERNKLGLEARIELFQEVCLAVQHAHQKCVLHRDIKPSNVLVRNRDGKAAPMIIDFGVAKATDHSLTEQSLDTEQGRLIGTPEYMSPEQAEMRGLDARADIYSLGVLLYELLTGLLPFSKRDLQQAGIVEIQRRIREDEPPKPSTRLTTTTKTDSEEAKTLATRTQADPRALVHALRGDLDWITMRCLEKDPKRRYPSAAELAADLQRHLDDEPVDASPPSAAYRLRKFLRKRRGPVAAGIGILLTLVAGLVIAIGQTRLANASRRAEASERARAERALASYQQMKDVPLAEDLVEEADDELWPAHPHKLDAMEHWLGRARALVSHAATARAGVAELEAKLGPVDATVDAETGETRWQLEDYEDRFLHGVLARLVSKIDRLVGQSGLIAQIEARRERAATLRVRSLEDFEDDWSHVIAAIAESELYADMPALTPQLGLVPLGTDPQSKLEEFAVLDSGVVPKRDASGSLQLDAPSAIVLVLIPPGTFEMGAQSSDPQASNYDSRAHWRESPVHEVRLDAFFLSKYEMTQGQWQRVMPTNPSFFCPGKIVGGRAISAQNPVETVSWNDCSEAMRRLGLVLPTEAQWEYGARAGTTTPWWTGRELSSIRAVANCTSADLRRRSQRLSSRPFDVDLVDGHAVHAPVGSFRANAFGLHDVIGNVSEWCRDAWGSYRGRARLGDGRRSRLLGGDEKVYCVQRGGSWNAAPSRSATRRGSFGAECGATTGLRPSRVLTR